MTAMVGVKCDGGCEKQIVTTTYSQVSTTVVRDVLKEKGWHKTKGTVDLGDGRNVGVTRDICPTCWKEGKR